MPSCPQCYVGLCKKHPRQDHGETANAIKAKLVNKDKVLDSLFNDLVGTRLRDAEALKRWETAEADNSYKEVQYMIRYMYNMSICLYIVMMFFVPIGSEERKRRSNKS